MYLKYWARLDIHVELQYDIHKSNLCSPKESPRIPHKLDLASRQVAVSCNRQATNKDTKTRSDSVRDRRSTSVMLIGVQKFTNTNATVNDHKNPARSVRWFNNTQFSFSHSYEAKNLCKCGNITKSQKSHHICQKTPTFRNIFVRSEPYTWLSDKWRKYCAMYSHTMYSEMSIHLSSSLFNALSIT